MLVRRALTRCAPSAGLPVVVNLFRDHPLLRVASHHKMMISSGSLSLKKKVVLLHIVLVGPALYTCTKNHAWHAMHKITYETCI